MSNLNHHHNVLIIGGGAAGMSLALHLAKDHQVALLMKDSTKETSTNYAQGGISAVLESSDHFDSHVNDTLIAGAGICDENSVRYVVENAPDIINWLVKLGMPFTREHLEDGEGEYHLTKEGGHSHRRVIHADDATGRALQSTLSRAVKKHKNITILNDRIAIDLITANKLGSEENKVCGAYILNLSTNEVETWSADVITLATGGANKVYLYSSNPDGSTGDGIAMAWRAGCRIANMEFMQFHPTCLYHPDAKSYLITEALRGEGAHLKLPNGERFMPAIDERAELAPRDIVARAIDDKMKRLGIDNVMLDISHRPKDFIKQHFPNIYATTRKYGINMSKQAIPVVPASHYTCGGVMTNLLGQTDIPNLYAIGETAYTGLHGANRLASNSLLECMVYAKGAAENIKKQLKDKSSIPPLPEWDASRVTDSDEEVVVAHNWHELRQTMWNYVGIVRTNKRLQRAANRLQLLQYEINEYYGNFKVNNDLIELRNLCLVSQLIVNSALDRKESRGLHYTLDYPELNPKLAQPTILQPKNSPIN